MGVLSAAPMSFKMERKCRFASKLKSLISDHLLHFCPDYSDDVLSEYITVLVCNGKNQNQARDDLEAFLGERSEEFVSWLWRLLLKYEHCLNEVISSEQKENISPNPSDTDRESNKRNGESRDHQSQGNSNANNLMGEGGEFYCLATNACKSDDMLASEDHPPPPSKGMMTRTVQSSGPPSKFTNGDYSLKGPSSSRKHQTKNVDSSEERRQASLLGRHPASLQGTYPASGALSSHGRKPECPQMHYTANALKRSLSPLPLVTSSHNNKPRRSVWDRLGKPLEDVPYRGQNTDFCIMNKSDNTEQLICQHSSLISKPAEQTGGVSPSFPMPTDRGSRTLKEVHQIAEGDQATRNDDIKGVDHVVKTISQVPSVNNIGRKRHFGELSSQKDSGATLGKNTNNQSEEVMQARKKQEVPLEASQSVVSMQDVKLRLRQVEIEMAKLRSKQIEGGKDGKTALSRVPGAKKPTDEDIESRTVIVTNVHYKANKEALSMYFQKCGAVVNVVILTDEIHPQRSAYITFESKESTDKALALSGTTFYSRTIMVSRKRDMASVSSAQNIGKKNRVHVSYSMSNMTSDRFHIPGLHLQWRRESLSSPASSYDQTKAAVESSFQQEPSAAPLSETAENAKQCFSASELSKAETR